MIDKLIINSRELVSANPFNKMNIGKKAVEARSVPAFFKKLTAEKWKRPGVDDEVASTLLHAAFLRFM